MAVFCQKNHMVPPMRHLKENVCEILEKLQVDNRSYKQLKENAWKMTDTAMNVVREHHEDFVDSEKVRLLEEFEE